MAVRTKRLAAGSFNTATVSPYTVPVDETAILKYLTLHNPSATTAATVTSRVSVSGSQRTWLVVTLAAGEARQFDIWMVLMPTESIQLVSSLAGNNIAYVLSGTELEGVAD
jgi:hypothetical protein